MPAMLNTTCSELKRCCNAETISHMTSASYCHGRDFIRRRVHDRLQKPFLHQVNMLASIMSEQHTSGVYACCFYASALVLGLNVLLDFYMRLHRHTTCRICIMSVNRLHLSELYTRQVNSVCCRHSSLLPQHLILI